MNGKLGWGIIGTGAIAKAFAKGLKESKTGELLAVGSRNIETANKFGDEFGVARRYGKYEDLLSDSSVEAVYIAVPHPLHAEWAIKTADAGKHVLCEKPLTLNHAEAMAVVEAARRSNVFLMEAFMYRCHPQTAKLVELVKSRTIGDVRLIQATFSFKAGWNPESRLLKNALGGGGILDVGCYTTSMSRLVAGAAGGKLFEDPVSVAGAGHVGTTCVDEYAAAVLKFENGIIAQCATGILLSQDSVVRIYGTEGDILVPSPWFCSREAGESTIIVRRHGEKAPREVVVKSERGLYSFEADAVASYLKERQAPFMSWADTLGNMKTLDRWRAAIKMTYEAEKAEAWAMPVDRRPLKVRPGGKMKYVRIEGVGMPVSRLVMGTMSPQTVPEAFVLYDDFFARGGNCFDTAYIYGGGTSERLIGQWMKNRDLRDKVIVVDKGGHTPFCHPEGITAQLKESLERLQTDYIDVHLLHRDNAEVPVGEFVDVLNEHQRAGRIRAFGVSNWTLDRVEAANAYAKKKRLAGIVALSNNFSLASMVNPVWAGTYACSDPGSRERLVRMKMPVLAWSSQARGFFARGNPDDRSDAELARAWYSDDNFERLKRARELSRKRGCEPINIALAYVLCHPLNVLPLIGPATIAETVSSFHALEIELTPDEVRWLNLEI